MTNLPPARKGGFKLFKLNRWAVAGGIVIVLGGGAIVYAKTATHKLVIPASDEYTVGYGTVTATTSAAGTIQPLQSIDLNFSQSSGTIASVTGTIGEHVTKGQVLAAISDPSAGPALQSAEAGLAEAQATLAQDETGATPQEIAIDQASVQKAEMTLSGAKTQYQDLVAEDGNRASEEQSVVSAQDQVNSDKAAVATAQGNVQSAEVSLQEAEQSNSNSSSSLPAEVTADQSALASAQAQLKNDQATLATDETDLTNDQATLKQDQSLYGGLASQYTTDEQAYQTALLDYNSWSGYGTNPYGSVVSSTSQAASAASNAYNTIQTATTQVQTDQTNIANQQATIQKDESSVASAQSALTTAEADESDDTSGTPLTVQAAQVALTQAQNALSTAETTYKDSQTSLKLAEAVYNDQTSEKAALDQAQNGIQLDENGVTTAQDQLNEAEAPATAATIQGAKASIQSAEAQVASAESTVQGTEVIAPINGVIVASNYDPGDTITSGTPVFVLDNTLKSNLEVSVEVSEADIGSVHVGQPVSVTTPAYPDNTYSGTVVEVEPNPTVSNDVTEYTVLTSVNNPKRQLMPGMTTSVSIQTGIASHVITIPAVALQTEGDIQGVYVKLAPGEKPKFSSSSFSKDFKKFKGAKGSSAPSFSHADASKFASKNTTGVYFQPVTVGLEGTTTVQIKSGLTAGETILLVSPEDLTSTTAASTTSGAATHAGGFGGGHFGGGGF